MILTIHSVEIGVDTTAVFTLPFPVFSAAVNISSWLQYEYTLIENLPGMYAVKPVTLRVGSLCIVDGMDSIATAWLLCTSRVVPMRLQAGCQVTSDVSYNTRPAVGWFSGFVEAMATEPLPIDLLDGGSVRVMHLMASSSVLTYHVVLLLQ